MLTKKKENILEYLLSFQLLFLSGSLVYYIKYSTITLFVWLVSTFYFYIKRSARISQHNIFIAVFLVFWILLSTFVIGSGNVQNNIFASYIFLILGSFFFYSSIEFAVFREILLKCTSLLFGISLLVHLMHNIGIIPAEPTTFDGVHFYQMSLFIFNTEWGVIDTPLGSLYRFASIYWEVGQAQIVLIYILLLFTDDIINPQRSIKYILKRYGILLLSILLTGSTTAYLSIVLFLIIVVYQRIRLGNLSLLSIFELSIVLLIAIGLLGSSVVGEKSLQLTEELDGSSAMIRLIDNLAALQVSLDNPICGLGCDTLEMKTALQQAGSITNSNGWLNISASMGFTYIIAIIYFMYKTIKKMNFRISSPMLLLILIISQCNEYFIHFPYLFMYIFYYKTN